MLLNITCYSLLLLFLYFCSIAILMSVLTYHTTSTCKAGGNNPVFHGETIKYSFNIDSVSSFMPGTVKKGISIKTVS